MNQVDIVTELRELADRIERENPEIATYEQEKEWAGITELQQGDIVATTADNRKYLFKSLEIAGLRCPSHSELKGDANIVVDIDPKWHVDVLWTDTSATLTLPEFRRRLEGTIASRKAEQEASKLSKLKFGVKVKTPKGDGLYWYVDALSHDTHWTSYPDGTCDFNPLSDITIVG